MSRFTAFLLEMSNYIQSLIRRMESGEKKAAYEAVAFLAMFAGTIIFAAWCVCKVLIPSF